VVAALAVIVLRGITKRLVVALQQNLRLSLRLVLPIRLLLEVAAGEVRKAVLRFLRRLLLLVVVPVLVVLVDRVLVAVVVVPVALVPQVKVVTVVLVAVMLAAVAVAPLTMVAMLPVTTAAVGVPAGHQRLLVPA